MTNQDIKALVNGYDRRKRLKGFRAITLEEVKAWSKPVAEECSCNRTHGTPGYFQLTVCDEDHAKRIRDIRGIDCVAGQTITMPCSCLLNGHSGILYRDTTPSHVWFVSNDGKARQAKVNGKVRTWKRNPDRVEVPLKYGLYEYFTFTTADIEAGRLLMPLEDC